MLSHIEVPILVEQIEKAARCSTLSARDLMLLDYVKLELLEKGTRAVVGENDIDRLDDIFCQSGVYAEADAGP